MCKACDAIIANKSYVSPYSYIVTDEQMERSRQQLIKGIDWARKRTAEQDSEQRYRTTGQTSLF